MSVFSKALTYAVVVGLCSGCAIGNRTGEGSDLTGEEKLSSSTIPGTLDGDLYGDSAAVDSAAISGSNDIAAPDERVISADPTISGAQPGPEQTASNSSDFRILETKQLITSPGGFGVQVERGQGFSRYVLDVRSDPKFNTQSLANPGRLVLDLQGERSATSRTVNVSSDPFIKAVRVGAHQDKTRVVFDLTDFAMNEGQVERIVDKDGGDISVTFLERSQLAAKPAGLPSAGLPASESIATLPPVTTPEASQADAIAQLETEKIPASKIDQPTEIAANPSSALPAVALNTLKFNKDSKKSSGQIVLQLNDQTPFELKQETTTEYVLTIPGATAAEATRSPLVSPPGFPGIRSARAVQKGDDVLVRMFVDSGVKLGAQPKGDRIVIESVASASPADSPEARAQISRAQPKEEEVATEVKVTPGDDDAARKAPTGLSSEDGSKTYTGRLISLDLQDTDIDNALRIIAEVSNLNIIASDDVTGKVTLRLIDVPWDQALDVILKTNGLDQVTEGNVIRIAPVDKLRQEREALLEAKKARENLEELQVRYIRVSYARATDLKEQVESVLTERGTVAVDERTNQVIIKDIGKGQSEAMALIAKLDLRTPQILLETQIVEAQRNLLRDLGFQWNYSYTASPETGNSTGLVFPNSVSVDGSNNGFASSFPALGIGPSSGSAITAILESADGTRALTARVSALEKEGKARVVSRPQVATVNNKEAQIKSVETLRIRLPSNGLSVATGQGAQASGGGNAAVEEIEVGITLKVTPQASSDYYVLLDVNAKSSTLGTNIVDNIPSTLDREATSTILVKSGQTFALGGIYRIDDRDSVDGVPFFKDLPVLGVFFRRSFFDKKDEELIFFITPHIVEGSFEPGTL